MFAEETIEVKWNSTNKGHYLSKGYSFTKMGDHLLVNPQDLTPSSKIKVKLICDQCHVLKEISFGSYTRSKELINKDIGYYKCHSCAMRGIAKTTDDFRKEVYDLVEDEYLVKGEYYRSDRKIVFLHTLCGKEYKANPNWFLNGKRCPHCFKTQTFSHQKYLESLGSVVAEFDFLSEYNGADNNIEVKHRVCGYKHSVRAADFLQGKRRCPRCSKRERKSPTKLLKDFIDLTNGEFELQEPIVNVVTPLEIKHKDCGHVFKTNLRLFLIHASCLKCRGMVRKDTNYFKDEVYDLVNNEYSVMGEYSSAHNKISLLHNQCGNQFDMTPSNFLRGQRCPECHLFKSKGEKYIEAYLEDNNIKFRTQYRTKRCMHKRQLPFDFAIINERDEVFCLIEYDGEHHTRIKERWGGKERLKLIQKRDNIKTNYCKANNIPLIRIPYWDFKNIDSILTERLTELGVLSPALVEV
ncbi:hypothetical protein [Paenibacillus silvae]|uniref:DUF2726 domain-containing protein n=1 Tax=Paenibacillus silvae TaxID=1325358 RepID=A0A2W6NNS4_9BACL|nr:hypothetical protein [Paenibacillus silvae]PZT57509.1 hypothetical protein DN757_02320 [Paenibacillus silvae]